MNRPFIKFLFVGIVNTLIGLSLMLSLLNWADWDYWTSTFVGNIVGAMVSYVLNRNFTFQSNQHWWRGLWRFALVVTTCYGLAYYLGLFFIKSFLSYCMPQANLKLIENIAVLIGMCIYTLLNYAGQKFYVFKINNNDQHQRIEKLIEK